MADGDRLIAATRARVIVPAAAMVYGAGEAAYLAHGNTAEVALGAAAVTSLAYAKARPLTSAAAVTGAWLTAATAYGPWTAAPQWWHPLTITWSAVAVYAVIAASRHPAVKDAKRKRAARRELLAEAHSLGIRGAHLISSEETRLGVLWELDITHTGRLASQIVHSGLAERIAMRRHLPKHRVQVTAGRIASRVLVSIRFRDPWADPIPHPLYGPDPEIELPERRSAGGPFPVGQDPETGAPLNVTLWDKHGGKVLLVVAKRGGGKSVLLNNIREHVTAAADADLWIINVSKAQEDRAWAPAAEYAACGPKEVKKACQILRAARKLVDERGEAHRGSATFQPAAWDRLKVIVIDEIDALLELADTAWVKQELRYLASKARSEGIALVIASQRAVHYWIGGTDVRANIDAVAVGKVQSQGEVDHAVGRLISATLPNMSTYGEGHPGVWTIVEDGGAYQVGRTFEFPADDDLNVLRELAAERAWDREPELVAAGNLPPSNLPAGNHSPDGDGPEPPPPPDGDGQPAPGGDAPDPLAHLDAELMASISPDTREQLGKIARQQTETKRILDEARATPPGPEVDQETLRRSAEQRWGQLADQTEIPADARAKLLALLAGDGMSGRKITEAFPSVKRWQVMLWLNKLRAEGLARTTGQGRGTRWVRTGNGDAP